MQKDCKPNNLIKSQATIVVTLLADNTLVIRSDSNGRSGSAKIADAIAKMAYAVMVDDKLGAAIAADVDRP